MEPAVPRLAFNGLVLDSSVLLTDERNQFTTLEAIRKVREAIGNVSEATAEIIARVGAQQAAKVSSLDG